MVKNLDYDGPYLDGHDFDPNFVFANAGDPEAQAQYQNELKAFGETNEEPVEEPVEVESEVDGPNSSAIKVS